MLRDIAPVCNYVFDPSDATWTALVTFAEPFEIQPCLKCTRKLPERTERLPRGAKVEAEDGQKGSEWEQQAAKCKPKATKQEPRAAKRRQK